MFLLGTTASSAEMAASLGLPYIFAQFLNSDAATMCEAMQTYHQQFDATQRLPRPQAMLALSVIVADSDAEARHYASDIKVVRIRLASGRTLTVGSVAAAEEFGRQLQQHCTIEVLEANSVHGCRDTVRKTLLDMQRRYQVDEVIAVTAVKDFSTRLHSYELLSGCL